MRKALLIGIDAYKKFSKLGGCVADATSMRDKLQRNADGTLNYDCRLFTSLEKKPIYREFLKEKWYELFEDFRGDILFYYSGHGAQTRTGSQIVTQDGNFTMPGLAMDELLLLANESPAQEVVLILDCCYSGGFGDPAILRNNSFLREGVTVLAASRPKGVAKEIEGQGVFTELVISALDGGGADVRGYVSATSIYAYVDQALGPWDQRPIYKSYSSKISPLRRCEPQVPDHVLRELPKLFPSPEKHYQLNPSYEYTHKSAQKGNVEVYNKLKLLRNAHLLRTVGGEDLFFIALKSGSVELTPLGQFYWRLSNNSRI